MSHNSILKYIYTNSFEEALVKGKKIFKTASVQLLEKDTQSHSFTVKVKDDVYNFFYKVVIRNYDDVKRLFIRCNCVSKSHHLCKHKIAALFLLNSQIEKEDINKQSKEYEQRHTIIPMKKIDVRRLKSYSTDDIFQQAQNLLAVTKVKIIESKPGKVVGEYIEKNDRNKHIVLELNEYNEYDTSCNCLEKEAPLCIHKVMLFLQLLSKYGADYFSETTSFSEDPKYLEGVYSGKNIDLTEQTEAERNELMKPQLASSKGLKNSTMTVDVSRLSEIASNVSIPTTNLYGVFVDVHVNKYPFFEICLLVKDKQGIQKVDVKNRHQILLLNKNDKEIALEFSKISFKEALKGYLKATLSDFHDKEVVYYSDKDVPIAIKKHTEMFFIKHFKKLFVLKFYNLQLYVKQNATDSYDDLTKISLQSFTATPVIKVSVKKGELELEVLVNLNNQKTILNDFNVSSIFFIHNEQLVIWSNEQVLNLLRLVTKYQHKPILLKNWSSNYNKIQDEFLPYLELFEFEFAKEVLKTESLSPQQTNVYVKETDNYLSFTINFIYKDVLIHYGKSNYLVIKDPDFDKNLYIKRHKQFEEEIFQYICSLSKYWEINEMENGEIKFYIPKVDALKNSWFLFFLEKIKERNILIYGMEYLKNFSPIEKKPTVSLDIKSNIDWLDVNVKIEIDDIMVSVQEIQNMFKTENNVIQLSNNQTVSVSKDWIKKFRALFSLAERQDENQNTLKLQNSQVGFLQYVEKEEDKESLTVKWDKKVKEISAHKNRKINLPFGLNKTLRNFQYQSVLWADNLSEYKCNGLLSDDMGLGKTIQALSILSMYKTKTNDLFALIICPTSLIHTWESEIQKFTPGLTYILFNGKSRTLQTEDERKYNLVITTYGTIRNDLNVFKQFDFDYIVLDESQNIKNPHSKTYQSIITLTSKHKLCLSGTPLQNNTIDMYSQMSFLNAGMFGSVNFFKNQFSIPIDKFNDVEIKNMLKKIIQPLILRRTKEEVSPELPEKTISTIYCEMEPEQRKIYEAYKNEFRNSLIGRIQTEGIQRSKLHILKALLVLRQICNTPYLVKMNQGIDLPKVSIKNDIIIEQIVGNSKTHKILVFSQFLGMLELIRDSLDKNNIVYEYLDGSMTAKEKKKLGRKFSKQYRHKSIFNFFKSGWIRFDINSCRLCLHCRPLVESNDRSTSY